MMPLSRASQIEAYFLEAGEDSGLDATQSEHRLRLLNDWGCVPNGARVLELGCGQGNCTAVLADAVGPSGTVDAVDPASLDYGAPWTLGQAQARLSNSLIGDRITWHQANPELFLKEATAEGKTWDVAILAHCIWYFKSPETLPAILRALKGRVHRVCIAEYALHATQPAASPHLLASLARAGLECHKLESMENIQTIVSPSEIGAILQGAGWQIERETTLIPEPGLQDGKWETGTVISEDFLAEIETNIKDERVKAYLHAARDAVITAVKTNGKLQDVQTMDVWTAVLRDAD